VLAETLGRNIEEGAPVQVVEIEGNPPNQEQTTLFLVRAKDEIRVEGAVTIGQESPPPGALTINRVLSGLSQVVSDRIGVDTQCQFVFSPDRYTVTPPLPIEFAAALSPASTFDEIRGLRLVKLAGKDIDYQIILDRPNNSVYYVNLSSRRPEIVDTGVFQRVFGWARAVVETIAQPIHREKD
jgi:hypothetical protein